MNDQTTSATPKASRRASLSPMNPLVLIALMALISTASIALYDRWRFQPVMSVDIERIMQTRMDTIKGMMTEETAVSSSSSARSNGQATWPRPSKTWSVNITPSCWPVPPWSAARLT